MSKPTEPRQVKLSTWIELIRYVSGKEARWGWRLTDGFHGVRGGRPDKGVYVDRREVVLVSMRWLEEHLAERLGDQLFTIEVDGDNLPAREIGGEVGSDD